MKHHKIAIIGLIIAVALGVLSNFFELDPFDRLVHLFAKVEEYEIDEIFIAAVIFLMFLAVDLLIYHRNQRIEAEKVKIYKAMLYSSSHIINNFLNQMLIFKMEAEETPDFDKNVLKLYDTIISDTRRQIDALSSVAKINEESIQEIIKPAGHQTSSKDDE